MSGIETGGDDPDLAKAVKDLEKAETHLDQAHEEEGKAKHEIADAIEEVEDAEHGRVTVHVTHVNDVEKAKFKEPKHATLQEVWDKSYVELKIAKKPKDIFQTSGKHPKSLMEYLALTLNQAREQNVIEDYRFDIVSEHGGA